jgi:chorismate mutase / prephenate dehydratase
MPPVPADLQTLRRRLDEIDDRLQDLLIDRAEIVSLVAASKKDGNQPAFQPAREAEIIRRLARRHRGYFPVANLVRMWREMLAATVGLQSPFSVAVFAPPGRQGLWDLARDHYGSCTAMTPYDAADPVLRAVCRRESTVGILPMPEASEPDPWWPRLVSGEGEAPRIVARLPFAVHGNARTDGAEALTVGFGAHQESGLDRTWLAMECAADIARARILKFLSAAGLVCTFFASCNDGRLLKLIEVEGYVSVEDNRLDSLRRVPEGENCRLLPMGGYAVPLTPAQLASKD